jgi:hypothetical protein
VPGIEEYVRETEEVEVYVGRQGQGQDVGAEGQTVAGGIGGGEVGSTSTTAARRYHSATPASLLEFARKASISNTKKTMETQIRNVDLRQRTTVQ